MTQADATSGDDRWTLPAADVLQRLGSSAGGLVAEEAARRLEVSGPNALPHERPPGWHVVLVSQFRSPLVYVLLGAMAVSLLLGDVGDAVVISAVLVINAAIGFTQQFKAERAVRALQAVVAARANVLRDGVVIQVASRSLVPGDVVVLEEGDVVPADVRLVHSIGLRVDESALTGESEPIPKSPAALPPGRHEVADRTNAAHLGSPVVSGSGRGVVVATGPATAVGRIAETLGRARPPVSPLERRVERLARALAVVVLLASTVVFAIGFLRGLPLDDLFLIAVAVAVSAMPEGLPAVVTVALAVATRRMAKRNAVVRRLAAVETLGSATVLLTDKTGTLTQNRMSVGALRPASDADERSLLRAAALSSAARLGRGGAEARGDPMELALLRAAADLGVDRWAAEAETLREVPFQTERRFSATVLRGGDADDAPEALVKGAPEALLPMCPDADPTAVEAEVRGLAAEGLRVLAVAAGPARADGGSDAAQPGGSGFAGLRWLGLVGLLDPPRPEAAAAVAACRSAGVRVVMCTGDHAATAAAIAARVGLGGGGGAPLRVVEGRSLRQPGGINLHAVDVFARVAPEQKLEIVRALQAAGEVVAVTGDGVNDAPALRAADLGCAMGRGGSDVAREAADVVLTDNDLGSVADAIVEGRGAFSNIRLATFFLLSTGAAEVVLIGTALALGWPLPLLPVQVLWLNVVTNGVGDVSLAVEPPEDGVGRRPPRPPGESLLGRTLSWRMAAVAAGMVFAAMGLFVWRHGLFPVAPIEPASLAETQCGLLTLLVMLQVAHIFNCRSERRSLFGFPLWTNLWVPLGAAASAGLHLLAMHTEPLAGLLHLQPLPAEVWGYILAAALANIGLNEGLKALLRWRKPPVDGATHEPDGGPSPRGGQEVRQENGGFRCGPHRPGACAGHHAAADGKSPAALRAARGTGP